METIPDDAFYRQTGITSITIPAGVTSIGEYAFAGCNNLTSVYYLGDIAGWCGISGLDSLMSNRPALYINGARVEGEVVIPDGVETIPDDAFYGQIGITSIIIPAGVTSIGGSAFLYCSGLTSIVIPNSVTRIEYWAFYSCGALESVYYDGTEGQWLKINIDDLNDGLTDADRYYYSETEPALNEDGSAYDGNYWRYADGVPTPWAYVSPTSENNNNI